ncbi:hypothetical protein EAO74_31890 [Streptomyces sp. gb1(2016)]|uniref:Uncharacterized protein n=1 Tax=Streptomyces sp. gb1(2016) TaxID=1828321 RepID=A0A652KN05_9ACTN|nr:hypothetical protein EAO74_31890 [Streptomyces sp. gb1(2016)]
MRPATAAAVAATSILGVGAAAVAAGRYASDAALGAPSPRPFPADRRLTVPPCPVHLPFTLVAYVPRANDVERLPG